MERQTDREKKKKIRKFASMKKTRIAGDNNKSGQPEQGIMRKKMRLKRCFR